MDKLSVPTPSTLVLELALTERVATSVRLVFPVDMSMTGFSQSEKL
jgi:hypothetical protein